MSERPLAACAMIAKCARLSLWLSVCVQYTEGRLFTLLVLYMYCSVTVSTVQYSTCTEYYDTQSSYDRTYVL